MFKSFFGKKKDNIEKNNKNNLEGEYLEKQNNSFDTIDGQVAWLKDNGWLKSEFNNNNKNILIMDDREEIISSIIDDLNALDSSTTFDIDNYNIITVSSKMAGFDVIDILKNAPDVKIDFALLDIVLGGKKMIDGVRVMVDGVDVAIKIWEKFPMSEILFFSGCIIESSPDKTHFKSRFDKYTGEDLNNYVLPKDISLSEEMDRLSEFFNVY